MSRRKRSASVPLPMSLIPAVPMRERSSRSRSLSLRPRLEARDRLKPAAVAAAVAEYGSTTSDTFQSKPPKEKYVVSIFNVLDDNDVDTGDPGLELIELAKKSSNLQSSRLSSPILLPRR